MSHYTFFNNSALVAINETDDKLCFFYRISNNPRWLFWLDDNQGHWREGKGGGANGGGLRYLLHPFGYSTRNIENIHRNGPQPQIKNNQYYLDENRYLDSMDTLETKTLKVLCHKKFSFAQLIDWLYHFSKLDA